MKNYGTLRKQLKKSVRFYLTTSRFLDIEYICGQADNAGPDILSQTELKGMLAGVSNALLKQLGYATLAVDIEASHKVISRIAQRKPDLQPDSSVLWKILR